MVFPYQFRNLSGVWFSYSSSKWWPTSFYVRTIFNLSLCPFSHSHYPSSASCKFSNPPLASRHDRSAGSLCQGVSSVLDLIVMCSTAALWRGKQGSLPSSAGLSWSKTNKPCRTSLCSVALTHQHLPRICYSEIHREMPPLSQHIVYLLSWLKPVALNRRQTILPARGQSVNIWRHLWRSQLWRKILLACSGERTKCCLISYTSQDCP